MGLNSDSEYYMYDLRVFRSTHLVKNPPAMQEIQIRSLDQEDPLEKEMATRSSILAWIIPWTEDPGGLRVTKESEMLLLLLLSHFSHIRLCVTP